LAALVATLAEVVARLVEVVAQWEGTHDGELCNTTLSCQLPRYFLHPQRNCMGPLDQKVPDAVVGTYAAVWAVASEVAWAVASAVAWGKEWVEPSPGAPAELWRDV